MSGDLLGLIDPKITIGNIIEIATIAAGGAMVLIRLNNTVIALKTDVAGMKDELQKLADVITKMAVTDVRLTNLEQDMRELRREP